MNRCAQCKVWVIIWVVLGFKDSSEVPIGGEKRSKVFVMNLQASVASFEGIDWAFADAERYLRVHTVYVFRVN